MFLARTVAKTTDVDGMLDRMTPQQCDEWAAMYRIRPWAMEPEPEQKPEGDSLSTFQRMAGF